MKNRVFITGATGVLGKRVVRRLVESGIPIIALSRSKENDDTIRSLGAIPMRGDLFSVKDMIKCTRDSNAIFHLATSIPKKTMPDKPRDWEMNDRIRVEGTENLLKAAAENNIKKFIQQSVTLLYGNTDGRIVNRKSAIAPRLPFMVRSAAKMEQLLRSENEVDHIIARFGQFYSADSHTTLTMIESIRKRRMPVIGNGNFYKNNIHVEDAADAIYYCFENFDRLKNNTINFTDYSPLPFREMLTGIVKLTGSKSPLEIPMWLARLILKKDMYEFITSSYRIIQDDVIKDWQPEHPDFIEGMKKII